MSAMHMPERLSEFGITLNGFRAFIKPDNKGRLAQDANALSTIPNTTIPAELGAYYDERVIQILTAPENAKQLLPETMPAGVTPQTSHLKFRRNQILGRTVPYNDYANDGIVDTNSDWLHREQYKFQTFIGYGTDEIAISALAKINLVSEKQVAAATIVNSDTNKFYLYGVKGRDITGFLNDPNYNGEISPTPVGDDPVTAWADKTTEQIYDDILKLYRKLVEQTQGRVSTSTPLVLAMSPEASVYLGKANTYNISVKKMLPDYFDNLEFVYLPELKSDTGINKVFLFARDINGQSTGEFVFGEKLQAFPIYNRHTLYEQKFRASTFGCIIRYPLAFAILQGV
jgi:hypothetical protein